VAEELFTDEPSPQRIETAYALIEPHIRRTPVIEVDAADFGLPPHVLTLSSSFFSMAARSRDAAPLPIF